MPTQKTYSEKLLDPRWQKKRLSILERDEWMCQNCGATDKTLHVHHKKYVYGKSPWEYAMRSLVTVCDECHENLHKLIQHGTTLNPSSVEMIGLVCEALEGKWWGCGNIKRKTIAEIVDSVKAQEGKYIMTIHLDRVNANE